MTDSPSAPTEIRDVASEAMVFVVDRKATVQGTVAPPAQEDKDLLYMKGEAHVIVTVPSLIPGHDPLSLPQTEMADFKFNFDIGERRLGSEATVRFTPGSNNRGQPPILLSATLGPSIELSFPKKAEMTVFQGKFLDSAGQPLPDHLVRAWVGSTVVSNLAATDRSTGDANFINLVIPSAALTPTSSVFLTMDLVEAAKPEEMPIVPQFVSPPFTPALLPPPMTNGGGPAPLVYTMPAYTSPSAASTSAPILTPFVVLAGGTPQTNVNVRFRAELPSPSGGTAVYQRSAMSDENGLIQVPLITGADGSALSYQVFLQPLKSDSMYASGCLPAVSIDANMANAAEPTPLPMEKFRIALAGYVFGKGNNGIDVPVVGAQVIATQIFEAGPCTNALAPNPASVTADSTGYYLLRVDPGMYRLDIVPPPTSPWPRLTEDGDSALVVRGAVPPHNVNLPTGEVVDGMVTDADGTGLPNATVRIFALACTTPGCTTPPNLLAEIRTDTVNDVSMKKTIGHFRTVLPPQ